MASLEKMEAYPEYSGGKVALGLAFSAFMVSLVAVVREATWRVEETVLQVVAPHWIACLVHDIAVCSALEVGLFPSWEVVWFCVS